MTEWSWARPSTQVVKQWGAQSLTLKAFEQTEFLSLNSKSDDHMKEPKSIVV